MIVTVSCSTCLRIQAFRMLTVIELVKIKNWLCLPGMLKQDKLLNLCFLLRSLDICGCSRISDNGICTLSKSCQRLELLDLTSTGVGHKRFVIYFFGSNFSFFFVIFLMRVGSHSWRKNSVKSSRISPRHHWFPAKWLPRKGWRNSILMTLHYPDLSSAFDWLCLVGNVLQPIRFTSQTRVVTRHQYGNSELVPQTSGGFRKRRLCS